MTHFGLVMIQTSYRLVPQTEHLIQNSRSRKLKATDYFLQWPILTGKAHNRRVDGLHFLGVTICVGNTSQKACLSLCRLPAYDDTEML